MSRLSPLGQSPGETVEIAEEMAARDALRQIFNTSETMSPLPLGQKATIQPNVTPNMSVGNWETPDKNEEKQPLRVMSQVIRNYKKG